MKKSYSGMQSPFIPWLGLLQQVIESDVFFIGDNFLFSRDSWVYRNRIKDKNNNQPLWLSIPIKKNHDKRPLISELEIDNSQAWYKKHLGSITANYAKAPFYKEYFPRIQEIYLKKHSNLLEFNMDFLYLMLDLLEIEKNKIQFRSSLGELPEEKNAAIIEMGKKCGANLYLSAAAGEGYVNVDLYNQNGIAVEFQKFEHPVYEQQGTEFISHLSALDALLNIGSKKTKKLLLESLS